MEEAKPENAGTTYQRRQIVLIDTAVGFQTRGIDFVPAKDEVIFPIGNPTTKKELFTKIIDSAKSINVYELGLEVSGK